MQHHDLLALDPAMYGPGGYFGLGEYLGAMGDWREHR